MKKHLKAHIHIKFFATLSKFTPGSAEHFPIEPGMTVSDLCEQLKVPLDEVKLIFINNKKGELTTELQGGERIGVFPPVGGG